jgi:co-chaperonin GroES (HSP10)
VLEPLGKWLAVNPIDDRIKETPSGILIAEIGYLNAMEYDGTLTSIRQDEVEPPTPLNKGTVASVGPDCREVAVGDKVLCEEWAGTEIDLAGVTYLMVTEDQVVGVLAP